MSLSYVRRVNLWNTLPQDGFYCEFPATKWAIGNDIRRRLANAVSMIKILLIPSIIFVWNGQLAVGGVQVVKRVHALPLVSQAVRRDGIIISWLGLCILREELEMEHKIGQCFLLHASCSRFICFFVCFMIWKLLITNIRFCLLLYCFICMQTRKLQMHFSYSSWTPAIRRKPGQIWPSLIPVNRAFPSSILPR